MMYTFSLRIYSQIEILCIILSEVEIRLSLIFYEELCILEDQGAESSSFSQACNLCSLNKSSPVTVSRIL